MMDVDIDIGDDDVPRVYRHHPCRCIFSGPRRGQRRPHLSPCGRRPRRYSTPRPPHVYLYSKSSPSPKSTPTTKLKRLATPRLHRPIRAGARPSALRAVERVSGSGGCTGAMLDRAELLDASRGFAGCGGGLRLGNGYAGAGAEYGCV
jgi:hypothetical protein